MIGLRIPLSKRQESGGYPWGICLRYVPLKKSLQYRKRNEGGAEIMKRGAYIAATILIMLVISRFLVRIVDATVQIDDNIGVLVLMLIVVNAAMVSGSYMLYRKFKR